MRAMLFGGSVGGATGLELGATCHGANTSEACVPDVQFCPFSELHVPPAGHKNPHHLMGLVTWCQGESFTSISWIP